MSFQNYSIFEFTLIKSIGAVLSSSIENQLSKEFVYNAIKWKPSNAKIKLKHKQPIL